ncbi:MAG: lactate utilization protein [Candidatus Brockarchaeota archaeon]|nr:lactate utilization protein [Candidatus Brockarchaeota archaeon]
MVDFEGYFARISEAASDPGLQAAIKKAVNNYERKKEIWIGRLRNIPEMARELEERRRSSLANLADNVERAVEAMRYNGMNVFTAKTAGEAREIVYGLLGGEKLVMKVKSLTTEEIGLNEFLQGRGVEVWETDVGAVLLQLTRGKAAHPTGLCISTPKEKFAAEFSRMAGRALGSDPEELVAFIREFVKGKITKTRVAVSGANAITADTGSIYILTNEGNDRVVTSWPEKHVVVAGIEKVFPDREAADLYARVMPYYTTGGGFTQYVSVITGISSSSDIERMSVRPACGPGEIDVVLLDNGRSEMLADQDFKEALVCIKCGACLLNCPVWNLIAQEYGESVYMGGMGIPWTLFTAGIEKAATQAYSCLQCGKCSDVCPMRVDVRRMVQRAREMSAAVGLVPEKVKRVKESVLANGTPYSTVQREGGSRP